MKKLLLSVALGGAVLGLAGCKSEPAPAPDAGETEQATGDATAASGAPSDEPGTPGTGEPSDDGQGGGINRPPPPK